MSAEPREQWYEFRQRETFVRPVYVKASSLAQARDLLATDQAVPGHPPLFPDLEYDRRGRIAPDQAYADHLADERQQNVV